MATDSSSYISPGVALVTGASAGIGARYAHQLAQRGYDLVLVARDVARLETLASLVRSSTGRSVDVLPADLTVPGQLAQVEARLADDPAITLLINNAGLSLSGDLLTSSVADLERIIALNVTAPTRLAAVAGRTLKARGAGAIVNLGSITTFHPERFEGVYSAGKAYILNLSLSMNADLASAGVHVQVVLPGATRTEIWERSGQDVNLIPPEFVMEADNLVSAALAGLDAREAVTIPALADLSLWQTLESARHALIPHLSRREPAARYRLDKVHFL